MNGLPALLWAPVLLSACGMTVAAAADNPPVTPPLDRAAGNFVAELRAALDGKQYADAARMLVRSDPPTREPANGSPAEKVAGLVSAGLASPSHAAAGETRGDSPFLGPPAAWSGEGLAAGDERLFVSYPTALRLLFLEHPELREAAIRQVGPADQLNIEQALAQGDPAAVAALSLQYRGTPSAALACQWLGDRALAGADLAQALDWYDEGLWSASPLQQPDLAARKRLVAAMFGSAEGQPPTQAVAFGAAKVPPEQFEGWIRGQLAPGAGATQRAARPASGLPLINVAKPVLFQASSFAHFHAAADRYGDVDWPSRRLIVRTGADSMFVIDRSRIAAFDLADGKMRWDAPLNNGRGGATGTPGSGTLERAALRPLVCGQRLYLRAPARSDRVGVLCLDAKSGQRLWLADCRGTAAADPLWFHGRLFVFAFGPAGGPRPGGAGDPSMLCLVELNPDTGEVLSSRPILELAEPKKVSSECQASLAGNRFVVVLAGNVICIDLQGKMVWFRAESTSPAHAAVGETRRDSPFLGPPAASSAIAPAFSRQERFPAIESSARIFIEQPGSRAIDCLNLATGQCLWRRGIAGLQSIVDLPEGRLLARTARGFVALRSATGEVLWQREVPDMLAAIARTNSGLLLCARKATLGDKPQIVMLWIDPATGETRAHGTIQLARSEPILFGPLITRGDRIWCCFAYAPADDASTAENEIRIIELSPDKPALPGEGS